MVKLVKNIIYLYFTEISAKERSLALNIYNYQKTLVLQSIGFGKKIDVPQIPKASFSKGWTLTKVLRLPPGIFNILGKYHL